MPEIAAQDDNVLTLGAQESGTQDASQIREIAYFLWIDEGCPEGRADDHWMLACGILSVQLPSAPAEEAQASPPSGDLPASKPAAAKGPAKH